jgi:hypothetical protein
LPKARLPYSLLLKLPAALVLLCAPLRLVRLTPVLSVLADMCPAVIQRVMLLMPLLLLLLLVLALHGFVPESPALLTPYCLRELALARKLRPTPVFLLSSYPPSIANMLGLLQVLIVDMEMDVGVGVALPEYPPPRYLSPIPLMQLMPLLLLLILLWR